VLDRDQLSKDRHLDLAAAVLVIDRLGWRIVLHSLLPRATDTWWEAMTVMAMP
jgi:hypothetical protein